MDRETLSEAQLVEAAASGNVGAFSQLVREYRGRVLRTACGIVGSTEEAEDVAQEVFVKVWNNLPRYRALGTFSSWLYRITVNAAVDALRHGQNEVSLDDWQRDPNEPPEEVALRVDQRQRVRRALGALPPGARSALILREYEQLSYKEIAEVLQIPIGTVMSRLNYARKLLKERLGPETNVGGGA
jgi:RNA polymerase sigma-70 factor (ECF subfamily)